MSHLTSNVPKHLFSFPCLAARWRPNANISESFFATNPISSSLIPWRIYTRSSGISKGSSISPLLLILCLSGKLGATGHWCFHRDSLTK